MHILEDCNIKLSSVVSDTSGVMATALIDRLCEGRSLTLEDIECVHHKRLAASPEELLEACTGFVEEHHVYLLQIRPRDMFQTKQLINALSARVKEFLSQNENVLQLLKEIPSFSTKVVEDLVAEIE